MRTSGRGRRTESRFAAVAFISGISSAVLYIVVGSNPVSMALCLLAVSALFTVLTFQYAPNGYQLRGGTSLIGAPPSSTRPPVRTDASHVEEALSRADRSR